MRLRPSAPARTLEAMRIKATVQVDFHLSPEGERTLALADGVTPDVVLEVGDVVVATDGESSHLAVVNSVNEDVLSLVVLRGAAVPIA